MVTIHFVLQPIFSIALIFLRHAQLHMYSWASAAGSRGPCPPWISIYSTDIVEKGLIVLFFGLFSVRPPMEEA